MDTNNKHNAFITDVENSRKSQTDRSYKPLATYMFYTPNMDDDGHDTNLGTDSLLTHAAEHSSSSPSTKRKHQKKKTNHIYTIFLGDMVKNGQKISHRYDHFDVLRTIESNFGLPTLNSGDRKASVITDVWK